MYQLLERRLNRLINAGCATLLTDARVGLEKENLRALREGLIAQTPHPEALGSALTHPSVTTDYSEALLELITPPMRGTRAPLERLRDLSAFVYQHLDDELLWATSMPCVVGGEDSIPIAAYGSSNGGMMRHIYRRGLGWRYGRMMQVIAGVHFNYSFSDAFWEAFQEAEGERGPAQAFVAEYYLGMIRNLQRFGWLIPYLFGASPAVCKSYMGEQATAMPAFDAGTYYEPYGTSLRMSGIGYQNTKTSKAGINVSYNSLDEYIASLAWAIETPHPEYEKIGVVVDGEYRQLNANVLQIENEYYSTTRPKQAAERYEKPTEALRRRGVRYVELRSLDIDAFDPLGIDETQLRFLEALMIFCLLHESPPVDAAEREEINANQLAAAARGREPGLTLYRDASPRELTAWGNEVCAMLEGICEVLDAGASGAPYRQALEVQRETLRDAQRTPSARILAEMRDNNESFFQFAMRLSRQHQAHFKSLPLAADTMRELTELAAQSIEEQRAREAADEVPFDTFLARYFAHR